MHILLVEDEPLISDGIKTALIDNGYTVDIVDNGQWAINVLNKETFNLIILDIGLPGTGGLEVLTNLRKNNHQNQNIPVLMLSARDTIEDKITGLEKGADDYMVKPFDVNELIARIRALLRRSAGRTQSMIKYKDICLDPSAHSLTYKNEPINLSAKEFSVLLILLENRGKVISKNKLEESIYSWDKGIESNALEVHIHHLRKKLSNELIKTIRGVGYMLT